MKALLISDDESIVTPLDSYLKNHQFDTIIYKWLIKALDNIEEIKPDLIVISAAEYPRHWKTLVQFVKSGIGGDNVKIFLYEPSPLSDEDKLKAKKLQVSYFATLEETDLKKLISSFFPEGDILFNHPKTNAVYSAKLFRKDDKRIQFKSDFRIPEITINDYINHLTLSINDKCEIIKGNVISYTNEVITLEVQD
ncbi:MAG: hypothetical protein MR958_09535 [Spirochaetia bacterium]|nr:hypothetical protein [Spirochaetia bacterium]